MTETIGEDGDSLITNFTLESNTHSDSEFCREYLEKRPEGAEAETVITDGAYGQPGEPGAGRDKECDPR